MDDIGTAVRRALGDVAEAVRLLTVLPVPAAPERRGADAAWAYPLAGIPVGLAGALAAWAAAGLPPALAAGVALAAMAAVTGALHEDGLADCADGLWSGPGAGRRLEVMRDSRIGVRGALALVVGTGLKWAALAELAAGGAPAAAAALVAAGAMSRAPMVAVMAALPHAREDGLSRSVGRPGRAGAWIAAAIALAAGLLAAGAGAALVLAALAAIAWAAIRVAGSRLGGQTGDVLGATQQLCEIAALAILAAMAS